MPVTKGYVAEGIDAMKLLLSAYACDPEQGSEPRIGWYFARSIARLGHEVWVVTHPRSEAAVTRALRDEPIPNLHIHFVPEPTVARRVPESSWMLLYVLWQRAAYRAAQALDKRIDFDVVHHVTWGSLQGGSALWRLGKPFIFGPVGGGQVAPRAFQRYFGPQWRREAMRSFVATYLLPYLPTVRNPVRHASLVLAANRETMAVVRRLGARRVELGLDVALPDEFIPQQYPKRKGNHEMTVVWVGRLLTRKALTLALEAIREVPQELPIRFRIVGGEVLGGEARKVMQQRELCGRVEHVGQVDWLEVKQIMCAGDAFLFTSLRDTTGAQILEAMGCGMPIIALDHQGARDMVQDRWGIRVPVQEPKDTVRCLANAVAKLYQEPELRESMGRHAWEAAKTHTWSRRALEMQRYYHEVVADSA